MKPAVTERRKIHPHKFALWLAMGSIAMMFAGMTSAYIVRMGQGNWRIFQMPVEFYFSTAVIVVSSFTIGFSLWAFRKRKMPLYRVLATTTLALGLLFGVLQVLGFYQLYAIPQALTLANGTTIMQSVRLTGNPAESFLFIIFGLHLAHILGGIVALSIVFWRAYRKNVKVYNATGLEIVATYWHFVDVLWIYLFLFFLLNR
ncbi:MAG: cytochrome c oxidase subunit 3 [Bacteroidetes bacterium]|nr:cytochrome c oxidase subunit 3 [Bacteroidota bacterium]MBS1630326.1 cytochrome c oxidase subunit 3 [Bacteroidota bacterium]